MAYFSLRLLPEGSLGTISRLLATQWKTLRGPLAANKTGPFLRLCACSEPQRTPRTARACPTSTKGWAQFLSVNSTKFVPTTVENNTLTQAPFQGYDVSLSTKLVVATELGPGVPDSTACLSEISCFNTLATRISTHRLRPLFLLSREGASVGSWRCRRRRLLFPPVVGDSLPLSPLRLAFRSFLSHF